MNYDNGHRPRHYGDGYNDFRLSSFGIGSEVQLQIAILSKHIFALLQTMLKADKYEDRVHGDNQYYSI